MNELEQLNDSELLTLAALARLMIRLDGQFTAEEERALGEIGDAIAAPPSQRGGDGAYRENAAESVEALGEAAFFELLELAGEELPDDASVREAARSVDRPEARASIHAHLHHLAISNPAQPRELELLEWLATEWQIEESAPPPEG
jgi:hypothetical protein